MDITLPELKIKHKNLSRQHNALVLAVDKLIEENEALKENNSFLGAQLLNANKFVSIQKQIVVNTVKANQEKCDFLRTEIQALKDKLKEQ
ncbi:MAG: hypothetical protein JRI94_00375 [Deltaproteobacteria bacterium]|nr:hypothetical protein [Deltaproteobacteria bacterium]